MRVSPLFLADLVPEARGLAQGTEDVPLRGLFHHRLRGVGSKLQRPRPGGSQPVQARREFSFPTLWGVGPANPLCSAVSAAAALAEIASLFPFQKKNAIATHSKLKLSAKPFPGQFRTVGQQLSARGLFLSCTFWALGTAPRLECGDSCAVSSEHLIKGSRVGWQQGGCRASQKISVCESNRAAGWPPPWPTRVSPGPAAQTGGCTGISGDLAKRRPRSWRLSPAILRLHRFSGPGLRTPPRHGDQDL